MSNAPLALMNGAVNAAKKNTNAMVVYGANSTAPATVKNAIVNNAVKAANNAGAIVAVPGASPNAVNKTVNAATAAVVVANTVAPAKLRARNSPLVRLMMNAEGKTRAQLLAEVKAGSRKNLNGQFKGNTFKASVSGGRKSRRNRRN